MKLFRLFFALAATCLSANLSAQKAQTIDLHAAEKAGKIAVYNRTLSLIDEPGYAGIRLSKDYGEGVAWLKGVEFSAGVLEFDVRGEDVKQHSFVGIAFHGQNDSTYEAIYLRPFQFRASDQTLRNRGIQYVSLPTYTWRHLRETAPYQYEGAAEPAPDPNGWVRVRIEVRGNTVTTFVNGSKEANLKVNSLGGWRSGSIGFYVADTSGGDFANISVVVVE